MLYDHKIANHRGQRATCSSNQWSKFHFSNPWKVSMNQSHKRPYRVIGMTCLIATMTIQMGCRTETSEPEVANVSLTDSEAAKPETAVETPVETPTQPKIKTEVAAKTAPPEFVNANFEAPIRLMVGSSPLNTAARQMYPSPAVYDVDHDGKSELIVGDIFGSLNVYENQSDKGDPVWSEHTALKSSNGKAIKVSNW